MFSLADWSDIRGYGKHGEPGERSEAGRESALCGDRYLHQHGASVHDGRAIPAETAALRAF